MVWWSGGRSGKRCGGLVVWWFDGRSGGRSGGLVWVEECLLNTCDCSGGGGCAGVVGEGHDREEREQSWGLRECSEEIHEKVVNTREWTTCSDRECGVCNECLISKCE